MRSFYRVLSGCAFIWCLTAQAYADEGGSAWFVVEKRFLDCAPKTLRPGQTLVLTLGPGHGKQLLIRRIRDDAQYFVISGGPPSPGDVPPPLTSEEFAVAKRLEISTSARANLAGHAAPIFSKSGRYTVYVSDNLESEEPGYKCEFTFKK